MTSWPEYYERTSVRAPWTHRMRSLRTASRMVGERGADLRHEGTRRTTPGRSRDRKVDGTRGRTPNRLPWCSALACLRDHRPTAVQLNRLSWNMLSEAI